MECCICKKDINTFLSILQQDIQMTTAGGQCHTIECMSNFFERLRRIRPDIVWKNVPIEIKVNEQWKVAYELGDWQESWTESDGEATIKGKYFALWKMNDSVWKLNAIIFTPMSCIGSQKYCIKKVSDPKNYNAN